MDTDVKHMYMLIAWSIAYLVMVVTIVVLGIIAVIDGMYLTVIPMLFGVYVCSYNLEQISNDAHDILDALDDEVDSDD